MMKEMLSWLLVKNMVADATEEDTQNAVRRKREGRDVVFRGLENIGAVGRHGSRES